MRGVSGATDLVRVAQHAREVGALERRVGRDREGVRLVEQEVAVVRREAERRREERERTPRGVTCGRIRIGKCVFTTHR